MNVKEVMNPEPFTVDENQDLRHAIQMMTESYSSCMLVVEARKVKGIITENDLTKLLSKTVQGVDISTYSLRDIMTNSPSCLEQTMSCQDALSLSRSRKIRHLPIVNGDDELVGLVTQSHLLDAYLALLNDNAELSDNIEELKLLSLEDPLMQIGNRRAMEVDLNFTEAEAKRHHKQYSLALIDIDYFKRFNDTYGHQAGDDALRQVAATLRAALRSADRIFRYGGEELLALMPATDKVEATKCAERLRESIEGLRIPNKETPEGFLTASIGLADKPIDNWSEMVARADAALYIAKESGRNQVFASP